MNEEEQRVAIGEAIGWVCLGGCDDPDYAGWVEAGRPHPHGMQPLPDFVHDLNAMAQAEKTLTPAQQDIFAAYLSEIVEGLPIPTTGTRDFGATQVRCTTKIVFATAGQRAEAFLRTLSKWRE